MNAYPFNPTDYPIGCFPPEPRAVIQELMTNVQAPVPLIGTSMLSAMAFACQGRIIVRRRPGLESPTSLNTLTIANSGERKSAIDGLTTRGIRELEALLRQRKKATVASHVVQREIHAAKRRQLISDLRRCVKKHKDTAHIEAALQVLEENTPMAPRDLKLIFADATSEALLHGLQFSWPSAAVFASEGGLVLDGHAMRKISLLNMLATGESISVDRKTTESFVLTNAKLTLSVMVQQQILDEFLERRGGRMRGSGGWTRYLVCRPPSTKGSRFIISPDTNWPRVDWMAARTRELLEDPKEPGMLLPINPRVVNLADAARLAWEDFHNAVEAELTPWGFLSDVSDYGSRIAENVARIAAIFHEFQGREGPVDQECMLAAIEIGKWYLQEFVAIFGVGAQHDSIHADLLRMHRYLNLHLMRTGMWAIAKNSIRQRGPIRDIARVQETLNAMAMCNIIGVGPFGRTTYVHLNPEYFGGHFQVMAAQAKLAPPPSLPFSHGSW